MLDPRPNVLRRRSLLKALAAAPLLPAAGAGAAQAAPARAAGMGLISRPDLHPPLIEIVTPAAGTEPGLVLLTPAPANVLDARAAAPRAEVQAGALIMDDSGQPVWFAPPAEGVVSDLKVQEYRGRPVLTHWEGELHVPPGFGTGQYAILDETYSRIATVRAANDMLGDMHDMVITSRGTALILIYAEVRADTAPVGGQPNSKVLEGVVQEIDIASGALLFEWRSLQHVGLEESFYAVPTDPEVWHDYIHLNSVAEDGDGLLISARCTHAVYRLDRATGEVTWRLGGNRGDFALGQDAAFAWQHDARRLPDGTLSLFDNAEADPGRGRSRALVLALDESAMTAEVVRSDESPEGLLAPNQGNTQVLANGHLFVGWGGAPYFSEYGAGGEVLFHGRFTEPITSYRSFRAPWIGRPLDQPAVAGKPGEGITSVYACWNGATEVVTWRVLAGADEQNLVPVLDAPRAAFETRVDVEGAHAFVAVEALDSGGAVLGASPPVPVG
ncbi:arylsulfotransferase family protein [Saccharopolyspora griseoalba]|uniref:Arylsulfotransferase family protein n=1 Tax=Saccharopolyspora griseoalba TaxID=1431848 RepID=A0ABW2LDB3_9PSEU